MTDDGAKHNLKEWSRENTRILEGKLNNLCKDSLFGICSSDDCVYTSWNIEGNMSFGASMPRLPNTFSLFGVAIIKSAVGYKLVNR